MACLKDQKNSMLEEICLMALTYRVSYKSLANMFKTTEEDVEEAFKKLPKYADALKGLRMETDKELIELENDALENALIYWTTRNKLIKNITLAKEMHNEDALKNQKEKLKQHRTLIDDSIVNGARKKSTNTLTDEEKEYIIKYRLKYFVPLNHIQDYVGVYRAVINRWENEYKATHPLYAKRMEVMSDYFNSVKEFVKSENKSRKF